jgi:hypothetical protein
MTGPFEPAFNFYTVSSASNHEAAGLKSTIKLVT